jgi:hypothetical protein
MNSISKQRTCMCVNKMIQKKNTKDLRESNLTQIAIMLSNDFIFSTSNCFYCKCRMFITYFKTQCEKYCTCTVYWFTMFIQVLMFCWCNLTLIFWRRSCGFIKNVHQNMFSVKINLHNSIWFHIWNHLCKSRIRSTVFLCIHPWQMMPTFVESLRRHLLEKRIFSSALFDVTVHKHD